MVYILPLDSSDSGVLILTTKPESLPDLSKLDKIN